MTSRLPMALMATLILGTACSTTAQARGMRFGFGIGLGFGLAAGAIAHHHAEREVQARRRAEIQAEEQAMRRQQERRAAAVAKREKSDTKPRSGKPVKGTETAKARPGKPAARVATLPKPALIPAVSMMPSSTGALGSYRQPEAEATPEVPARFSSPGFAAGRAGQPISGPVSERTSPPCSGGLHTVSGGACVE